MPGLLSSPTLRISGLRIYYHQNRNIKIISCNYTFGLHFYLPRQLRGPALKGRKAYGCLPMLCSGKNRSGLKTSGSGNIFGLWCIPYNVREIEAPAGIS